MKTEQARFDEKYQPVPWTGCWLWTAAVDSGGYGRMKFRGRIDGSNRISWTLFKGEIPAGKLVCHTCDVKACVNPDHLYIGDPKSNMADARARGQHWVPDRGGDRNGNARITQATVNEIRTEHANGDSQQAIADRHGISFGSVNAIVNGKHWRCQ